MILVHLKERLNIGFREYSTNQLLKWKFLTHRPQHIILEWNQSYAQIYFHTTLYGNLCAMSRFYIKRYLILETSLALMIILFLSILNQMCLLAKIQVD